MLFVFLSIQIKEIDPQNRHSAIVDSIKLDMQMWNRFYLLFSVSI